MQYLNDTISHKDRSYIENKHYKYFIIEKKSNDRQNDCKIVSKKEMFLTYNGIIKVLFTSRSGVADQFQDWATETLFTVQMGTTEQKNKLVSKIKGVSYESIQEMFYINARTLPCVYLTAFNDVKTLREIMNINSEFSDNDIVYKFGLTSSFENRKNGHKSEYAELKDQIDMTLVCYTYIDPLYLAEAENELKDALSSYKLNYNNHDELVIIPKDKIKNIRKIYELIGYKYSGHTAEFNKKISELENHITNLNNQLKLKDKELELKDKDILLEKQKSELLEMKLTIMKLQTTNCN